MGERKRGLFDVLGTDPHENWCTTLSATLSDQRQGQEWTRIYFEEVLCQTPPIESVEVV